MTEDKELHKGILVKCKWWGWALILTMVALFMLILGYFYYTGETLRIKQERLKELTTIGEFKANHIAQWRKERILDVEPIITKPFKNVFMDWLGDPGNPELRAGVKERLLLFTAIQDYVEAFIVTPEGEILISSLDRTGQVGEETWGSLQDVVANPRIKLGHPRFLQEDVLIEHKARLGPLHLSKAGIIVIDTIAPLCKDTIVKAMLVVRSNPDFYLYPILKMWPIPTHTSESILVRRDKDEVVFLSALRFKPGEAFMHRPLIGSNLPAAQVLLGKTGIYQGVDYRGTEVVADLRAIQNSSWSLITKIDASEIYREIHYRSTVAFFFVLATIAVLVGLVFFIYKSQQAINVKRLYVSELRQKAARQLSSDLIQIRITLMEYSVHHTLLELLQKTLDEISRLTGSTIGFYHSINEDEQTISLQAWSTRTLQEFCKVEPRNEHYPISEAGIWTEALKKRKTVIHNDYASLPGKKGMPEGHAEVVRQMIVPVERIGKIVALLGIGNKPTNYTEADTNIISYIADVAWEIAGNKRAEEALQDSEKKYRNVVENANTAILGLDTQGNLTFINEFGLSFYGYEEGEILNKHVIGTIVPEKESTGRDLRLMIEQVCAHPEVYDKNINENMCKDGRVVWTEWTNKARYSPEGEIIGVFCIGSDITARKKAEEALAESEQRYRSLFSQMKNAVVVYSVVGEAEDFIIRDFNAAAETIEKVTKAEVIGKPILTAFPGAKEFGLLGVLQRVWRTEEPEHFPTAFYSDDRIEGWRENFIYKLPTGEVVALYSDETSRKIAEVELRGSENRYRRVVETVDEGLVIIKDGIIKFANPGAEKLFGREKEQLVGQHIQKFVDKGDILHFMEIHEKRMSGDFTGPESLYTKIQRPNGEYRRIKVRSVSLTWEGGPASLCAVDDITETELLESRQQLVIEILKILNEPYVGKVTIRNILVAIQEYTKVDSIGIRLKEGEDYPYFVYSGFSHEFIKLENSLCRTDRELCIVRDAEGLPILECMCGCVIRGNTDSSQSFFTERGSFWTNSTSELLSTSPGNHLESRKRCNLEGYESVAIIPISAGLEVIGTLQLNNRAKDTYTESLIIFMEELALTMGVAVKRSWQEDRIKVLEVAKTKDLLQSSRLLNSGIAHELRTPMQALLNCFELIREETIAVGPPEAIGGVLELVDDGLERTEYSVKVLNSLSEYSKIASAEEIHLINVVPELKTIMRTLMFTDQFKGLKEDSFSLTNNVNTEEGCFVSINRVDFSQLITNLCRNSREAILHEDPKINIAVCTEEDIVRIKVTDNGRGIPSSLGDKIFEPYFSTKENPEGYNQGLGLAMVRDIIAAYGGGIAYNSHPGHTEFIITLPCEKSMD